MWKLLPDAERQEACVCCCRFLPRAQEGHSLPLQQVGTSGVLPRRRIPVLCRPESWTEFQCRALFLRKSRSSEAGLPAGDGVGRWETTKRGDGPRTEGGDRALPMLAGSAREAPKTVIVSEQDYG